jgi:transcription antitermination factor NusG
MHEQALHWTVIYVASRQEKVLASRLAQLNIEHYLPLVARMRIWSDRRKKVEMPLFNGYLFVRPTAIQRDVVLQQPGAVAYVRYNGQPARVGDNEIDTIRSLIACGYDLEASGIGAATTPGTRVRITQGPLAGFEGEIVHTSGGQHFFIALHSIEQNIRVKLPAEALEAIPS